MPGLNDANTYVDPTSSFVPVDWVEITPGPDALARPVRCLRADTDCTVTVKTAGSDGDTRDMKFLAGETRLGMITHVTAVSAGAVEGGI